MAKTTEELVTIAQDKATKAETKRVITIVKEQVAAAAETEDKASKKAVKELGKAIIEALKA